MFLNAEVKSRMHIGPSKATLYIPETYLTDKFKAKDKELPVERIEKLIFSLRRPTNGLIVTIYVLADWGYQLELPQSAWPFSTNVCWPFKFPHMPKDYITIQKHQAGSPEGAHVIEVQEKVIEHFENKGIDIRYIDYSQDTNYVLNTMAGSKLHVSYRGASWWIAHYLEMPVLAYGDKRGSQALFGAHNSSACQEYGPEKPSILSYRGHDFVFEAKPEEYSISREDDVDDTIQNKISWL